MWLTKNFSNLKFHLNVTKHMFWYINLAIMDFEI
jgi:hypothetical protein